MVATLVDETRYTRAEISALYRKMWHVELRYLLRALMARTAQMTGQTPRKISFRAAQQTLRDVHMMPLECR